MTNSFSKKDRYEQGFALVVVLMLITVMGVMTSTYMILSRSELQLAKASKDSASGFNVAEAGLNIRAEEIRAIFENFSDPVGVSPSSIDDCDSGTLGSGDFECRSYSFKNSQTATTFVTEEPNNPVSINIPPGEAFAGLNADEYRYTVSSVARNVSDTNEAFLDLTFKSRVVPMFQFAIFFKEDLEFFNGATMSIDGPIHTNSDLYLAPQDGGQTDFSGQLTIMGDLFRGQKSQYSCSGYTGLARVQDPGSYRSLPSCASNRRTVDDVTDWNDNIITDAPDLQLPPIDVFDAFTGVYWEKADLRLVLRLNANGTVNTSNSPTGVEVVDVAGNNIAAATNFLHNKWQCSGQIETDNNNDFISVGTSGSGTSGDKLRLYREYQHSSGVNNLQRVLEIDMRNLLNCIDRYPTVMGGKALDDDTEKGLVFHFTVDGPDSGSAHNNYSVRIRNASRLQSNRAGAPDVRGMTVVSDQGLVVWGDYNRYGWIPASIIADTMWLLSNSWDDGSDTYQTDAYYRTGNDTTVQAAVITGIARTGGANGPPGRDHGADTNGGGVINFMRFNEWFRSGSGTPDFTYVGSIVSLGPPKHSASSWGPFTYYSAPNRVWSYDERFNDPENLPPMTPVFVYNKQELFVRDYDDQ